MYKRLLILSSSAVFALYLFLSFKVDSLEANIESTCGNGVCQASKGEDTLNCPADCGPAATPTPPPPTPQPTIAPTQPPTQPPTTAPTNPPTVAPTNNPTSNPSSTPIATNNPNPTPTAGPNSTTTPTSGPNTTAVPTATSSSTSENQTNDRFLRLDSYPSGNINGTVQNFIGSSNLVEQVEYSLNNSTWTVASGTTNFTFTLSNLSDGSYTVKLRGKFGSNYFDGPTTDFVLVNQAPEITFNIPSIPTDNTNFEITGNIDSTLPTTVEISINGGATWLPTLVNNGIFRSLIPELEDGNYIILVRAIDSIGNITISEPKTLIIDTLSPTLGTQLVAHGPLVVEPTNNIYETVSKTPFTLFINILGGATKAELEINSKKYQLNKVGYSNIWSVDLNLAESSIFDINLYVEDGAENTISSNIGKIDVKKSGNLTSDVETTLTVYQKDFETNTWFVWNGATYNQSNPKVEKDSFSFVLPKGTYYLDAKSEGYQYTQSKIFSIEKQTIVNFDINQPKLKSINFNLPFFGKIEIKSPLNFVPKYIEPSFDESTFSEAEISADSFEEIIGDNSNFNGLYILTDTWSPTSFDQAQIINSLKGEYKNKVKVFFIQGTEQKVKSFLRRGNYEFNYDFNKNSQIFNNKAINSPTILTVKNGKVEKIKQGIMTIDDAVVELTNL